MVPRYSRPAMTAIWSAENRYRIWFAIEVFAAEAMGRAGTIPAGDAAKITDQPALAIRADETSELILVDVPLRFDVNVGRGIGLADVIDGTRTGQAADIVMSSSRSSTWSAVTTTPPSRPSARRSVNR